MEYDKNICPVVGVEGFVSAGKQFDVDIHLPEDFIKGLAIVCEDFSYQCQDFPVFGLKGNEIVKEIKNILSTYLPF